MTPDINQLTEHYGLGKSYYDYRGKFTEFTDAARTAILQAMGAFSTSSDANTVQPQVWVCHADQRQITVEGLIAQAGTVASRTITLESGAQLKDTFVLEQEAASGISLWLPELPLGYHHLALHVGNQIATGRLIIAPQRSYEPQLMQEGTRLWGLSIQLYTLRSATNFGMGDFADLQALIRHSAPLGCRAIGLNPLHALRPADPGQFSPYSPSHRARIWPHSSTKRRNILSRVQPTGSPTQRAS